MDPIAVDPPAAAKPAAPKPDAKPADAKPFGLLGAVKSFTRKQAIGACVAALSLCAGVAVVNYSSPAADQKVVEKTTKAPPKAEPPAVPPGPPGVGMPTTPVAVLPLNPPYPSGPAPVVPSAAPILVPLPATLPPPVIAADPRALSPYPARVPDVAPITPLPVAPSLTPADYTTTPGGPLPPSVVPAVPPVAPPPLTPPLIPIGATDGKTTPAVPPVPPLVPTAPPLVPTAPPLVPTAPPLVPTAPPLVPTAPPLVPTAPPLVPTAPPLVPTAPPLVPTAPPLLPTTPPLVPTAPPLVPTAPALAPAPPALVPIVTPAAGVRAPQTTFDVDLHDPRAGDSYESISKSFYNDARYGASLAAYNQGRPLSAGRAVEVPPVHVLRQRYGQLVGGTGGTFTAADPTPTFRSAGKRYVVPAGGTSLDVVAQRTLGSATRWREIYDLNPGVTPERVAAGTDLRLPPDANVP